MTHTETLTQTKKLINTINYNENTLLLDSSEIRESLEGISEDFQLEKLRSAWSRERSENRQLEETIKIEVGNKNGQFNNLNENDEISAIVEKKPVRVSEEKNLLEIPMIYPRFENIIDHLSHQIGEGLSNL